MNETAEAQTPHAFVDPPAPLNAAMRTLLVAIRDETAIDDDAFLALITAQPDKAARKRLSQRLRRLDLITDEQHVHALIRFVFRDGEAG